MAEISNKEKILSSLLTNIPFNIVAIKNAWFILLIIVSHFN
jgi:hypothetical protein